MGRPSLVTALDMGTRGTEGSAQGRCPCFIQRTSHRGTLPGGKTFQPSSVFTENGYPPPTPCGLHSSLGGISALKTGTQSRFTAHEKGLEPP